MSTETEEWRPVVGYEGLYEVSSLGRVRSLDRTIVVSGTDKWRAPKADYERVQCGKVLRPSLRRDGYLKVNLYRGAEEWQPPIHRLVCAAFHGAPQADQDAAHWDGVKTNNRAENLRWASRAENLADKVRHGTSQRGERASTAKLREQDVREIRLAVEQGETQTALAQRFNVTVSSVSLIVKRKNWAWVDA